MARLTTPLLPLTCLFLAGCPRPGLAPETETDTTTSTDTDTTTTTTTSTTTDTTTSSTSSSSSSDTGSTSSSSAPVLFVPLANPGVDFGSSVFLTASGDVLWSGALEEQGGDPDAFVQRVHPDGEIAWTYKQPGGAGTQWIFRAVESGPTLFGGGAGPLGNADADGFVQRVTPDGLFDGLAEIASPGADTVAAIAPAGEPEHGVYVAGTLGGTAPVPASGGATFGDDHDLFVMRIQEDDFVPWNMVCAGADATPFPHALLHDKDTHTLYLGLALTGILSIPFAPPGDPADLKPAVNDPSDGLVLVIDATKSASAPVTSALLFRSEAADSVDALAGPEPDGTFYVAGSYTGQDLKLGTSSFLTGDPDGEGEGFVARVKPDGTWLWVKRFGGTGKQRLVALAVAGDRLLVGGILQAPGTLSNKAIPWTAGVDMVLARLDKETGDVQSFDVSDGAGDEWITSIAADGAGFVWFTGDHSGALSFAGKTSTANGEWDAYLFRLPP